MAERFAAWIAPLVVSAGLASLTWSIATAETQRSFFQWGVYQTFLNYDQSIPLIAIGLALSRLTFAPSLTTSLVFAASFSAGLFGRSSMLPVLGPSCLIIAGAMLIVPERLKAWASPVATLLLGTFLGMTVGFDAPQDDHWLSYVLGAVQIGSWLIAVALLLWRALPHAWSRIARPIVGSWLIAMGLLLSGATLAERPPV
jgi:hydrogenase/urease accessory protein HupE